MHFLDLTSLLSLALCNKKLYNDADSEVAWRHVPGKVVVTDRQLIPETTVVRHHKALVMEGYDVNHRIPDSILARVHELIIKGSGRGKGQDAVAIATACRNISICRIIALGYGIIYSYGITAVTSLFTAIRSNKKLRELQVSDIYGELEEPVGKLIVDCPHIHTLDMISARNIPVLLESLGAVHKLNTLCIDIVTLSPFTSRNMSSLAAILRSPSLTSFKFKASQGSNMNWIEFAEFIIDAPSLTALDLSGNNIDKDGLIALCEAAQKVKTLQRLIFNNNPDHQFPLLDPIIIDAAGAAELHEKYGENSKKKFSLLL
jgi:hypothetical protein